MAKVKFLQNTQAVYDALTTYDANTFYFTGENLYLGEIKLSNAEDLAAAITRISGVETSVSTLSSSIGTLSSLSTTAKSNLVAAINEVLSTAQSSIQEITTGTANGTIAVDGTNVAVKGLAAGAYTSTYAASSSAGGAATSANKLNTDAGSVTNPVYFSNGIPVKTTYTLGASVPSGAKFTDTTYSTGTTTTAGLTKLYTATGSNTDGTMTQAAITDAIPTNVSELTNDAGYLTSHQDISGKENASNKTTSITTSSTDTQYPSAKAVKTYVDTSISALPDPMVFKGTLGTSGTISTLPTAASGNVGYTYKVITAGTYASQSADVGDMFISDGSSWILVPSGDEPSGTVTNVATGVGLTGGPITSTGTIKVKLKDETANSSVSSKSTSTSGGLYSVEQDSSGYLAVRVPWSNTTYSAATTSAAGLMSASDKTKLDGIDTGANAYTLPTATSSILGGVKIGSNITVSSGTISLTKSNVTSALGYTPPTSDTTYDVMTAATSSAAGASGLVPAPAAGKQASFLRGDGTWATPTNTLNTAGSTDSSSKLFLIGATSQTSSSTTYSQDTAYVGADGHLYSNGLQVVNLSGTQALTNKTYNGYTLAAACAKTVIDSSSASAISTGTGLVTERDVYYGLPTINGVHTYTSSTTLYAPTAVGTSGYVLKSTGSGAPSWVAQSTLSVGSATSATKATQDASGNTITSTYIKSLSASGGTITYTKGGGTTGTVTVKPDMSITITIADDTMTITEDSDTIDVSVSSDSLVFTTA